MTRRLLSLWFPNGLNCRGKSAAPADLQTLALWCQRYSPLTATDPPDGIFVDITGCAHLFGGESGLHAHILKRLPDARLAIANTAAAAWALARYGGEDLQTLPLAALQLSERTIVKLRRVGVRRIGELARLPRAELTAGYGPEPGLRLAQAFGAAPEVLRFVTTPPDWREILHFAEPIFAPAQLQAVLARLTESLCARLAKVDFGATELTARFYRVDMQCPEFCLRFASPCRDDLQISKLAREKLQTIDPGWGVEAVSLQATGVEISPLVQRAMGQKTPDFSVPVNSLLNRLGPENFWRAKPYDSHIPEYAARRGPVILPPVPWAKPRHERPLKLLKSPHPITAMAPVPDDPPAGFSWHGRVHKIRHATGPERIAREWWRHSHDNTRPEADFIRDYYAVEDMEGARFWLFRAGTHDGFLSPRWYLHGFFG